MSIKFNGNEIRYMALFESMTGAMVKDCIIDEENGRVTFVVKNGDMGLAIGKKGATVTKVQKTVDKGVEIVEHSEDPIEFLQNLLAPAQLKAIKIIQKEDKEKIANITVEGPNKGLAIGKNGQTIERAKLLAKRQHNVSDVVIK